MADHTSGARTGDSMDGAGKGQQTHTTPRSVVFDEQTLADKRARGAQNRADAAEQRALASEDRQSAAHDRDQAAHERSRARTVMHSHSTESNDGPERATSSAEKGRSCVRTPSRRAGDR